MRSRRINSHNAKVIVRVVQLLTPPYPPLDAAVRSAVQRDVALFVNAQIKTMPSFLRLPYRLALLAFDWLPAFAYRRRFVALADDHARAYLALWSERGPSLTRDFVKLMRSCALLAYFDHPQVRGALDAGQVPSDLQRAIGNGLVG
jgi:hypothetical protein